MKVIGFAMPSTKSAQVSDLEEGWHPADIKAAIHKRGMTLSKLAVDNGLTESCVRAALLRCQPAADAVISSFLGVPLHELWPDRWDAEGLRVHHVRDETTANPERAHRLSAGAA